MVVEECTRSVEKEVHLLPLSCEDVTISVLQSRCGRRGDWSPAEVAEEAQQRQYISHT